ncbi:FadR/GntR family transcriptional regulator [Mycolicibacterium sp. CBMA 226]|uniref:FadR/GntR family transcriptional regulator n=1 Tax=Mycolicibacterium sp. CBMA 226 TaxID=2606611 RepID=UPI0012DCB3E3|nr:GntR family transcriptional regulator [Mycolicibacterium sp. CBMA 226]MUL79019.1 GntR family transcriptional regulator [Mycolicibacterium sp. CBMA 226]QGW61337.1 Putative L-lactate dehydrogenase operon regulatory protein [Mycolicibacterium sp.]
MSWRTQLAFTPLDTGARGAEVGRRLRYAIELGILEDGARLPSESELAVQMGVSTNTVREGLSELRRWGLLETRRGRGGGSFVRANRELMTEAQRATLAEYSVMELRDMREFRAFLAGSAAAAAAQRSPALSLQRLSSLGAAIRTMSTTADAARADSRFHLELAAASQSVRLTQAELAMQAEVGPLIWMHTADSAHAAGHAADQHLAVVDAIGKGSVELARTLAEEHVRHDMNRLIDLRMSASSKQGARPSTGVGGEAAITEVMALGGRVLAAATESIEQVETAVLAAIGDSAQGDVAALAPLYDVTHTALRDHLPWIRTVGFTSNPEFFGVAELIACSAPAGSESIRMSSADWTGYDFSTAVWWPHGIPDNLINATGAFVDASGSNEYIVAFSKAVLRGSVMLGVASADCPVEDLQSLFEPVLVQLPRGTCVFDQNGIVIATNTASLIGGSLGSSGYFGNFLDLPGVPWKLRVADPSRLTAESKKRPRVGSMR